MGLKNAFKPSKGKILGIIIIFALISTYGFVPVITSPQLCMSSCTAEIGWPYIFLFYTVESGETTTNFNAIPFTFDIVAFYLALCLISLIFEIGRRKNVPSSNSGGRDSGPADQAGPQYQELS